jgi:imidazole glycerol phosphate synthase glutamine amidotransferase subunit
MFNRCADERPIAKYQRSTVIAVIDYGAGNLRSVTNVLDLLQAEYRVVRDAASISEASKVLLPGVGHFGQLSSAIDQLDLRSALIKSIRSGIPYLGICLGMQVLFSGSDESPESKGLGIFDASVHKFESSERVPHMGWNTLESQAPSVLVEANQVQEHAYFAHSYFCPVVPSTTFTCEYGSVFSAVVEKDNVFGVQFHPEKSAQFGVGVIRKFVGL